MYFWKQPAKTSKLTAFAPSTAISHDVYDLLSFLKTTDTLSLRFGNLPTLWGYPELYNTGTSYIDPDKSRKDQTSGQTKKINGRAPTTPSRAGYVALDKKSVEGNMVGQFV